MSNYVRINFFPQTSLMLHWSHGIGLPAFMKALIDEFKKEHCLHLDSIYEKSLSSEVGIKQIIEWLVEDGYKCEYWQLFYNKTLNDGTVTKQVLAYGIKFDNRCEKFIELKLKSVP